MAELVEDLGLVVQPAAQVRREGELQDHLPAVPLDEEGRGRRARAEPPLHGEAAGEEASRDGGLGVAHGPVRGTRQLVLHLVEPGEELGRAREPARRVGVGRLADELLERRRDAVRPGREDEALAGPQDLGHLERAPRGGLAGEEPEGQRPEREDVQVDAVGVAGREGLGRHVDRGGVFDELVEVLGAGDAPRRGRGRLADAGLPVEDLHPGQLGVRVEDEEAPGRERAVEDPLPVGVPERLAHRPEDVEALVDREGVAPLAQVPVEAERPLGRLEEEGRAEVGLDVLVDAEDARVVGRLQQLELAPGRLEDGLPRDGAPGGRGVDPDAAPDARKAPVPGREVLEEGAFEDELLQLVVPHPARARPLADPGVLDGARQRPRQGRVDRAAARGTGKDGRDAGQLGDDARQTRARPPRFRLAAEDAGARLGRELHVERGGRAEDDRVDPGHVAGVDVLAVLEERLQPLGLEVRQEDGVVDVVDLLLEPPDPAPRVPRDRPRAALDLDHEEARRPEDEEVHLVQRPVEADELDVRPRPVRLEVRQPLPDVLQRFLLPREPGRLNLLPALRRGLQGRCLLRASLGAIPAGQGNPRPTTVRPNREIRPNPEPGPEGKTDIARIRRPRTRLESAWRSRHPPFG